MGGSYQMILIAFLSTLLVIENVNGQNEEDFLVKGIQAFGNYDDQVDDSPKSLNYDDDIYFEYDNNIEEKADSSIDFGRNKRKQLHTLCEVVSETIRNHENGYEYYPLFYTNTTCVSSNTIDPFRHKDHTKEFCYLRGASSRTCQTKLKTLTVFKRKLQHRCWEPEDKLVAVGCDCNIGFKYYHN